MSSNKSGLVDTAAAPLLNMVKTNVTRRIGGAVRAQSLPSAQAGGYVYTPTVRTLASTFPSNMFAAAGKKSSEIPRIDYIKHLVLKVEITVSGSPVQLVPCQYWASELQLRDSGSGEVVQRAYDDTSLLNTIFRTSAGRQRALFKSGLNLEPHEIGKYGLTRPLPVGTHTFFIPVLTSVFENFHGLFLNNLQGELMIDWFTPSTIIASGAGSISSSVSFMVESADLTDKDAAAYKSLYSTTATECRFLQPHRSEFLSKQLTAGQVNKLPLRDVDGLCAFQVVMVRPTGMINDNSNFNTWRLLNLGDANGAAMDLTDNSGLSILGNGGPIPTRWLRQHQSIDMFDSDFISRKPIYILSYTDSINGALAGRVAGGRPFSGTDANEIRIQLPPAPVAEVQTVTFSQAPAAGSFYSFSFRGEQSAQIAGNASVAVMKSTIEAMREVKARGLTVTASAVASAGTSFTLTFSDPEGTLDGDLFEVNVHDGAVASASSARTTAGIPGLVSGQYDIYVYSYLYHSAAYVNNKLRSQLLVEA